MTDENQKIPIQYMVCGPLFEKAWDVLKLLYHNSVFSHVRKIVKSDC